MTNQFVKHFNANPTGRDLVVGDLHGCYNDLMAMLKLLNFNKADDRLFAVGDLIDRGPQSMECLELLYEDWFHSTKGNHEDLMCLSVLYNNSASTWCWESNGGTWHWEADKQILRDVALLADNLPLIITVGEGVDRFNIVHAELLCDGGTEPVSDTDISDWTFTDYDIDAMIWGRKLITQVTKCPFLLKQDGLSVTFVGHTPLLHPVVVGQHIYLDTGAVFARMGKPSTTDKFLTIAHPSEKVLYQYNMFHKNMSIIPFEDIKKTP